MSSPAPLLLLALDTSTSTASVALFDGLRVENMEGNGSTSYMVTSTMVQTSVVETGGGNAESLAAGGTIEHVINDSAGRMASLAWHKPP